MLLLCACTELLLAQSFYVEHYSEFGDTPLSGVNSSIVDNEGYVWIASDVGLFRFDGRHADPMEQQIAGQTIRYLHRSDTIGQFWITQDEGIGKVKLRNGSITYDPIALLRDYTDQMRYLDKVHRNADGTYWITQLDGVVWHYQPNGELTKYYLPGLAPRRAISFSFASDGLNNVWLGASTGQLYHYSNDADQWVLKTTLSTLSDMTYYNGNLWIAGDALYRQYIDKGRLRTSYDPIKVESLDEPIDAITHDDYGNLYVATKTDGLMWLRKNRGVFTAEKLYANNDPHRIEELPFTQINELRFDNLGRLWVSAENGLGCLQERFFQNILVLPNDPVNALALDNNKIWTNIGDLYEIDMSSDDNLMVRRWSEDVHNFVSLQARGGTLYTGDNRGIIAAYNEYKEVLWKEELEWRGEGIFYSLLDSKERYWFCQAPAANPIQGIGCRKPSGELKFYGANQGLGSRILVIKESPHGYLYAGGIGDKHYLYRYDERRDQFINHSMRMDFYVSPTFEVHDLAVDTLGQIWLATTDGLLVQDIDHIHKVDLGPELEGAEIRAVLALKDGSLWLSTDSRGLVYYDGKQTLILQEESGLPSKIMAYRSLHLDARDKLWVGTTEGLVYSSSETVRPQKTPLPHVQHKGNRIRNNLSIKQAEDLSLSLSLPHYSGYRTTYRYRTDLMDDWEHVLDRNKIEIPRISHKMDSIWVQARHEGPYYWSESTAIAVRVERPWYRRPVIILAIAGSLLLGLAWLWRNGFIKYKGIIKRLTSELRNQRSRAAETQIEYKKVVQQMQAERTEAQHNLVTLSVLAALLDEIQGDTKWDTVIDVMSLELIKMPGTCGFEIATLQNNSVLIEGYDQDTKRIYNDRLDNDPSSSLASYIILNREPILVFDSNESDKEILSKDSRMQEYRSLIAVPFRLAGAYAALLVFSKVPAAFDEFDKRSMVIFANYLENVR